MVGVTCNMRTLQRNFRYQMHSANDWEFYLGESQRLSKENEEQERQEITHSFYGTLVQKNGKFLHED